MLHLIPKWVWGKCGGFDPTYFMYWEDVDLSIRMERSGVRIKFVPEAKLWHKVSSSVGGEHSSLAYYYASRNRLYGIRKLSLGLIPRLWAYGGILQGIISREPINEYAAQAYIDYRRGSMGQRTF
jgi:GT2 family glycosyltransferase